VTYDVAELDEVALAYATTVHKSRAQVSGGGDPAGDAALPDAARTSCTPA